MVFCDFRLGSVDWRMICLYAPNSLDGRRHFNYCNVERIQVLMEDFNCVLAARNKSSGTAYRDASTAELHKIINEYGLEDVAKCLDYDLIVRFTHFQAASHAQLDREYVPAELIALAQEYCVQSVSFSDHCLVMFDVNNKRNGISCVELWKPNAKIYEDGVFCEKVLAGLEEIKNQTNTTICERCETLNQTAKLKALERASTIKHEKNKYEENLRQSLQMLTYEEN
uniref:Putative tick transposon n=1 Tax=Rhipicephalus microplus TaxID=6941 RepID=A0A6G5A461_RHIMP